MSFRPSQRQVNELRKIKVTRNYTKYAEGSVLIEFGDSKIICTATVDESVPSFLKGKGTGWLTAEYSMLPRATGTRNRRDISQGKPNARSQEIQRLIGRSLRSVLDFTKLGERQIIIDCDVIQADGGTRTASITGAYIALVDAINSLLTQNTISENPLTGAIAAVSVGVYQGIPVLDLDYLEDSNCDSDINVVMNNHQEIIEIQGTAEGETFSRAKLNQLLDLAEIGIAQLLEIQQQSLSN
ncbi:MAG: ribonuclease PH [Proteobacteria bacterium]|nr:MAG: ribonuclease PH [Pseudomonadota bacterium]